MQKSRAAQLPKIMLDSIMVELSDLGSMMSKQGAKLSDMSLVMKFLCVYITSFHTDFGTAEQMLEILKKRQVRMLY